MRRIVLFLALAAMNWLYSSPAQASSDFGCAPSLKLFHPDLTGCDNLAIPAPGNDTRVNLVLLLLDRHGGKGLAPVLGGRGGPDTPMQALFGWREMRDQLYFRPSQDDKGSNGYADGEGSRCRSNEAGAASFNRAVGQARKLRPDERSRLVEARAALVPNCAGGSGGGQEISAAAAAMTSSAGKAFARYLEGALAFYDGDFDTAARAFAGLRSAPDPWVRETARYMVARVEINRAQVSAFDEYGYPADPSKTDQTVIDAAEAALLAYLRDYPRGLYANSAKGLVRRVYWLGGRLEKLSESYAELFATDPNRRGIDEAQLAEEIDNKLLPLLKAEQTRDPTLLAVLDLFAMRACGEGGSCTTLSRDALEGQRSKFSGNKAAFEYLMAVHALYVANRPEEVLRLIPDEAPAGSLTYLQFGRQVLRRMAMERMGQQPDAALWLGLAAHARLPYQHSLLQLAAALSFERSGMAPRIFDPQSSIRLPLLRETVLTYVADAQLLRARARDTAAPEHERDLALFILLYKELSRGAYRDFLADLSLVRGDASASGTVWSPMDGERVPLKFFTEDQGSEDFSCPPIRQTAATLANDGTNIRSQLCVAEFMRLNGFDETSMDGAPAADELGGTASLFPGKPFSRLETYKKIMSDARASADEKAYALYRAIRCYAPVRRNSCGGTDVALGQRKAWFQRLKGEFPNSVWAKELRYYW